MAETVFSTGLHKTLLKGSGDGLGFWSDAVTKADVGDGIWSWTATETEARIAFFGKLFSVDNLLFSSGGGVRPIPLLPSIVCPSKT